MSECTNQIAVGRQPVGAAKYICAVYIEPSKCDLAASDFDRPFAPRKNGGDQAETADKLDP